MLATFSGGHLQGNHERTADSFPCGCTGASGLVIEEKTANNLGLASFGEVHVAHNHYPHC